MANDHDLLTRIDERVGNILGKVGGIELHLTALNGHLAIAQGRIAKLEGAQKAHRWVGALIVSLISALGLGRLLRFY